MEQTWFELVLKDEHFLSGKSVHKMVCEITDFEQIKFVRIADLVGACGDLLNFKENEILTVDLFLERIKSATQFDWAFFYLYKMEPSLTEFSISQQVMMQTADVTIRLVDDEYFYIYSLSDALAKHLSGSYPDSLIKTIPFTQINVPY